MLFFLNDYGQGCIPSILDALKEANDQNNPGYGLDKYNKKAAEMIAEEIGSLDCEIHFIISGTMTNVVMIRHCLRPYQGVISADSGHINVHEAGAVEASGHKIITAPNSNGKLTVYAIKTLLDEALRMGEHVVLPKAVYISNATELGTVYTRDELESISVYCKENGLYLIMDGARIGNALTSGVDYTLKDICQWCDMFSVGITKNGALFGEAVIIKDPELKKGFRYVMKQSGTLLPKNWLLGLQFICMFEGTAFYDNARHANEMAMEIQKTVEELGYPLLIKSSTNQVFPVVSKEEYEYLKERVDFELWTVREDGYIIRFVTSWHTSRKEVRDLKKVLIDCKSESSGQKVQAEETSSKTVQG